MNWAPSIVGGEFVINGAYHVSILPFGRDWITITPFSSIHLVGTRLALQKKDTTIKI